jgi:hypothetical protein
MLFSGQFRHPQDGRESFFQVKRRFQMDEFTAGLERAELYFIAYPRTPSAVRRPKLSRRSGNWIALLGRNLQEGICGFGPTVEAALRAFDSHYLAALRAPETRDLVGIRAPVQGALRRRAA